MTLLAYLITPLVLLRAGIDFLDGHLRQATHEDVAETFLKKIRDGEYSGQKPRKGYFSDMFPNVSDGHILAHAVMQQALVINHLANTDPHDLTGCAPVGSTN